MTFTHEVETLTPEMAEQYLLKVDHNPRRVMPTVVARYARDVGAGNWPLGGGFLAFDECGCLVQGQHTCHAVIAAGKPIQIVVFRGLTPEAVRVLDTGKLRTQGMVLSAEGYQRANGLAAAVRTLWKWERGLSLMTQATPTLAESMEWIEAHPEVVDAVKAVDPVGKRPLGFRTSVAAAIYHVACTLCPEDVDPFFIQLESGANLAEDSPILTLRNWLITEAASRSHRSQAHIHAVSIKAWNAWITGKKMRQIKWLRGGATNEPFPKIIGRDGDTWPGPDAPSPS